MRLLLLFALALPAPALAAGFGSVPPAEDPAERTPGVVVAVHGSTYVLQLGDEPAVGEGTVLQVYRRLPSPRGAAAYRNAELYWDVGRLAVASVAEGVATATQVAGPAVPIPADLDESGAPSDRVQIGDLVRTTGSVAERATRSRVAFPLASLFSTEAQEPHRDGERALARWGAGVKRIEGPVEVRVRTRLRELGSVSPDISRSVSATRDAPEGPVPGEPTTPVMDLYTPSTAPVLLPPGREVHVVEPGPRDPETWRYLDPVTLAHRRAEAVADAVAAATGLEREAILVTVTALPELASHEDARGYDRGGDAVWILAGELEWEPPPPIRPKAPPKKKKKVDPASEDRERRPFERFPRKVS